MKQQVCALLCAALLAMGAGALAQTATYVFPYEGFRYTQREDETVLTQTNLRRTCRRASRRTCRRASRNGQVE